MQPPGDAMSFVGFIDPSAVHLEQLIAEYEAADRTCRAWAHAACSRCAARRGEEVSGPARITLPCIWREGHPLDRDKLEDLRRAKVRLRRFLAKHKPRGDA
jgi:hypothetical protein